MKKTYLILVIVLIIAFLAIYRVSQSNKSPSVEEKLISSFGTLKFENLSEAYKLIKTEIVIDNASKYWSLIGVDKDGYYFTSNEIDEHIDYYFYDIESKIIRSVKQKIGNNIYNVFFHQGEIILISKEIVGSKDGGMVSIYRINLHKESIDVIYEDEGTKYPIYAVLGNKIIFLNCYKTEDTSIEFRITSINLNDGKSEVIDAVTKSELEIGFTGEEIVRIGGNENTLYAEFGKYDIIRNEEAYYIKKYDLSDGKIEIMDLKNPVDYISGYENLFVMRSYSKRRPIKSGAVSVNVWNNENEQYNQHIIFDTDSLRCPYNLNKIGQYYILLQSYDIKIIDIDNLKYDTVTYREMHYEGETKRISQPFVIENSIYTMQHIDSEHPKEMYILQYEFQTN